MNLFINLTISTTARGFFFTGEGSINHCRSTSNSAVYFYCTSGTVKLAGTALHTIAWTNKINSTIYPFKNCVRTNSSAKLTINAQLPVKLQRVVLVKINHFPPPSRLIRIKVTERTIPPPSIHAILGMYANISLFTPLLEVNVVAPVKFNERKAVTGARIKI